MVDYSKHDDILALLKKDQEAETDNREMAREATHFLNKRDGQWEPNIISALANRPRYTFDKCNPVVDQIMGEIEQSDFSISVQPAGALATKEVAKTYDGLIRNIENISNAGDIFNASARYMVSTGIDGWRVVHDWVDADTFEQDLLIKPISNYIDRVWFDCNAELQDMSDAKHCFVLQTLSHAAYEERFPKGSKTSIGDERSVSVYSYKKEGITVGEILYKKTHDRKLVLMSNNAVYEDDEKFQAAKKDLLSKGIKVERTRVRPVTTVYTRFFDGGGWLGPEKETVFDLIPVVPVYGNFKIVENKVVYWGAVEKLMDSQRVYNYAKSRQIEEGALAPRDKYWLTMQQAEMHLNKLRTLNTNADPVQFYTHVEGQPPPFRQGGANVNPGLQQSAIDAAQDINVSAGLFSANMGDNPGLQSGVAIGLQQNKGDNGTYKYFSAQKIAITHTARILVKAIPKVYDTKRQVRLLGQDGAIELTTINDKIVAPTGKVIELNDLSKGSYDVVCTLGPAFKNRQQETVKALTDLGTVDNSIISVGSDILLSNINAPGINLIAERKRAMMIQEGLIPVSQMTPEELELVEAMKNNPKAPTPVEQAVIAQAQAELEKAKATTQDIYSKIEERAAKFELAKEKLISDMGIQQLKVNVALENLNMKIEDQHIKAQAALNQQIIDAKLALDQQIKIQAETLNLLKESMGSQAIITPGSADVYLDQVDKISETQQVQL